MGAARNLRERDRAGHDESGQASARPGRSDLGQPGRTHADAADRHRRGPAWRGVCSCHRQRRTSSPATSWWSTAAGPPGSPAWVQPLRFGLIGCGQQGREHVAALGHVAGDATGGVQRPRSGVTRRGRGRSGGGPLRRLPGHARADAARRGDRRHDPRRARRCRAGRAPGRLPRLLREAARHERGARASSGRSRASEWASI